MAVYNFHTTGGATRFQQEGFPWRFASDNPVNIDLQGDDTVVFNCVNYRFVMDVTTDTININEVAFAGTALELMDVLMPLFIDANSGSGSGSGSATILESPDGTLWQLGVSDAGVLSTAVTGSGTAGTLQLTSPDNTVWNVTVNNSGALTTTAV
jgi:hypothetical protein